MQNTVADFDPQQVVDTVRSGTAPKTWRVFHANPEFYRYEGAWWVLRALLFLGMDCFFWFLLSQNSSIWTYIWPFLALLALLTIVNATVAIVYFVRAPSLRKRWIAVTPTGVMEYFGDKFRIGITWPFADILSIEFKNQGQLPFQQTLTLTFWRRHPTRAQWRRAYRWRINSKYPLLKPLAQSVILAQRAYRSTHPY